MDFIPVILFLIFVVVVAGHIAGFVFGHGTWTKSFEYIATRYGGWFTAARMTRPPAVTFQYKKSQVRVRGRRSRRNQGGPETEFRIRWPGKAVRLAVLPAGRFPKRRTLRGNPPVPTGDARFDACFSVFTDRKHEPIVLEMLTSVVRWQISQIQNLIPEVTAMVSLEKGWLVVRKKVFIKQQEPLDDFVRFSLELFDQLSLSLTEGIDFPEDMVMSAVDQIRCPICSSQIEGKMVLCVRCKTPHCLDCWQYNRKCGMYACEETRYAMVGDAQV